MQTKRIFLVQELTKLVLLVATPKIFGLPKVIAKRKGSTVSLSCNAKGYPYRNYKWVRRVPSTNLTRTVTGRSLVLTKVTENDDGDYTCVASNAVGNDSFDVRLSVHSEYIINDNRIGIILAM